MIDNQLHQHDGADLNPHSITWNRVLDVNDRALRNIVVGLGSRLTACPAERVRHHRGQRAMAVLALAASLQDMRSRLGRDRGRSDA